MSKEVLYSKAWFKRCILHAPNQIAELSACKMRRLKQLNSAVVEEHVLLSRAGIGSFSENCINYPRHWYRSYEIGKFTT